MGGDTEAADCVAPGPEEAETVAAAAPRLNGLPLLLKGLKFDAVKSSGVDVEDEVVAAVLGGAGTGRSGSVAAAGIALLTASWNKNVSQSHEPENRLQGIDSLLNSNLLLRVAKWLLRDLLSPCKPKTKK